MEDADDRRIIVRQYGGTVRLWPAETDAVYRQMADLWDSLLAIEQAYREAIAVLTAEDQRIAAFDAELAGINDEIERIATQRQRLRRQGSRVRSAELDALSEELSRARTKRADCRRGRKDAGRQAREAARDRVQSLGRLRSTQITSARHAAGESGLYWGNYNDVVQKFLAASLRARMNGGALRPARRNGQGTFTVQVMPPVPVQMFLRGAAGWSVDSHPPTPPPGDFIGSDPAAWLRPYTDRRGKPRALFGLTVVGARGTGGRPIQAVVDLAYHRPLPEGAEVSYARLIRRREGGRWIHLATIVCRKVGGVAPSTGLTVGIDVGFRRVDEGLRVAVAAWEDGSTETLILPNELLARHERIEGWRSGLDKLADRVWRQLVAEAAEFTVAPDPLRSAWQDEMRRRSSGGKGTHKGGGKGTHKGLLRLQGAWPEGWRDDLRDALQTWALRRARAVGRLNGYRLRTWRWARELRRKWVASLVKRAGCIVLEQLHMRPLMRGASDGSAPLMTERQRKLAMIAAPRTLLEWLAVQASASGTAVLTYSGKSTWLCNNCGYELRPSDPSLLMHTCSRCGAVWDQDENAARNLLAVGLDRSVA